MAEEVVRTKIGAVSAYALAKKYGYTGTAEEFATEWAKGGNYALETRQNKHDTEVLLGEARAAAGEAKISEVNAGESAEASEVSNQAAAQALRDLLHMLGTDVATLVGGKIPTSQLPALATTEIYTVDTEEERDALEVQNGDICVVSYNDESLARSFIFRDGGWVYLASPTDYASKAGYAETAGEAQNAATINGHRLVVMDRASYDTAVLDKETFYMVYDKEAET